ncbi:hypothetical protein AAFC00_000073 [Neodothiora populina]
MNTVATNLQHSQYPYCGEKSNSSTRYAVGHPRYDSGYHYQAAALEGSMGKADVAPNTTNKPRSPVFLQHPKPHDSKKESRMSSIAPSLQIPRSVNNSQGSLAELAAQITCLFWFESSATLGLAESFATYKHAVQPLVPDAIPSTGFRKWVTTILSTTQVAQNVIILALLFVYRLKKLNPSVKGKPGSEYRLLTVALMLGNKFLDDNTYTNKTWAEVSGISVSEVHVMEVEFLSNMKYALFTSAEEWDQWQTKLGMFASFFDQASHVPAMQSSTGALGITLPSPPISNHASPPYSGSHTHPQYAKSVTPSIASTPNPSPLGPIPKLHSQSTRKRSLDDASVSQPAKRHATTNSNYGQTFPSGSNALTYNQSAFLPRVPLPSLGIPLSQSNAVTPQSGTAEHQQQMLPQLPPLNYNQRSYGSTPVPTTSWTSTPSMTASVNHYQPPVQLTPVSQGLTQPRHQSPYPGSAGVSPTHGGLSATGQTLSSQLSPSYYLEQRNSPYRPIRSVSTLLVPPPQRTRDQPQHVCRDQMHYQPLGRPQELQTGQLPYIAQNQWIDGNHQTSATAYQWPSFLPSYNQQQLPLPTPSFGRT